MVIEARSNKAFYRDAIAVSHLLQGAQKLRHGNSAPDSGVMSSLKTSESFKVSGTL